MPQNISPLRYPGGRNIIYNKLKATIIACNIKDVIYVEPFAGGFGIGLRLLYEDVVDRVILNDFDIHIYNFWYSVLNYTDQLVKLIENTPITIDERLRQKNIYDNTKSSRLEDGFATLFLNRVNFSGIIKAGVIGGNNQTGSYHIDCRFNKTDIIAKVRKVAKYKKKIQLKHKDAKLLLKQLSENDGNYFFYLDPPYVIKGSALYTEYFSEQDHYAFADAVRQYLKSVPWVMTYDKCELISKIYKKNKLFEYTTSYNAKNKGHNVEYVITNIRKNIFKWD